MAADAGNADAMDFVGFVYLRGALVKRRPEIAFGYFKAGADESAQAAFNLGQCYFGAQGTEQDCSKALEWWEKAAAQGHGRAAATAAMAYLSGEGVPRDVVKARRLAERAAELRARYSPPGPGRRGDPSPPSTRRVLMISAKPNSSSNWPATTCTEASSRMPSSCGVTSP